MPTTFCPSCGTEVDESVLFCPNCGQAIEPTPASPPMARIDPAARGEAPPAARTRRPRARPSPADEPPQDGDRPEPQPPPPPQSARRPGPGTDVPFSVPTMLSGWLIGGGAAVAALGTFLGLFDRFFNPIDALLLPAFAVVAASVFFFADRAASWRYGRVATLVVALVGFGAALDRIGFGAAGIGDLLIFLGAAAASIGAVVAEVGLDQPFGGGTR